MFIISSENVPLWKNSYSGVQGDTIFSMKLKYVVLIGLFFVFIPIFSMYGDESKNADIARLEQEFQQDLDTIIAAYKETLQKITGKQIPEGKQNSAGAQVSSDENGQTNNENEQQNPSGEAIPSQQDVSVVGEVKVANDANQQSGDEVKSENQQNIIYDSSNDVVDTCDDAKKLLISKKAISEDDSCVCGGTGITCGDKDFNFKEIKENVIKVDDGVSEIKTEQQNQLQTQENKQEVIESKESAKPKKRAKPKQENKNVTVNQTVSAGSVKNVIQNQTQCNEDAQYMGNNVWKQVCGNKTFNITIQNIDCDAGKIWHKSFGDCIPDEQYVSCGGDLTYSMVEKRCVSKEKQDSAELEKVFEEQKAKQAEIDANNKAQSVQPVSVPSKKGNGKCQSPNYEFNGECVSDKDVLDKYCKNNGGKPDYKFVDCSIDLSNERYTSEEKGKERVKKWFSKAPVNMSICETSINLVGNDFISCWIGNVKFVFEFDALDAKEDVVSKKNKAAKPNVENNQNKNILELGGLSRSIL